MSRPTSHATIEQLEFLERQFSLREKLDIKTILFRQVERCNLSITNPDPSIFEANVRTLMNMLPTQTILRIRQQTKKFNETFEIPQLTYWCGVPQYEYDKDGNRIEPETVEELRTDYEKLYELIMAELEVLGVSWTIEQTTTDLGEVRTDEEILPGPVVQRAKEVLLDLIIEARSMGFEGSYEDLMIRLSKESIPSPYIVEEEEETNGAT